MMVYQQYSWGTPATCPCTLLQAQAEQKAAEKATKPRLLAQLDFSGCSGTIHYI